MYLHAAAGAGVMLLLGLCLLQQLTAAAAQAGFLQEQLPLRVLVTTPAAVATYTNASSAVALTGRQALTVSHLVASLATLAC
jgi:hypothetical protein